MPTLACLNGEIMPVEEAKVPVWDRGFLFGDSIYEVFRLYRGRLWLEAEHRARLAGASRRWSSRRSTSRRLLGPRPSDDRGERDRTRGWRTSRSHAGRRPGSHPFPDPPVPPTELIVIMPV